MTAQKNVAPVADEDVTFPPRIQQVIDLIADAIANRIRAEQRTTRADQGAGRSEREDRRENYVDAEPAS